MDKARLLEALDTFISKVDPDILRWRRMIDRAEPQVKRKLLRAIAQLQGKVKVKAVDRAIRSGSIDDAIDAIDWKPLTTGLIGELSTGSVSAALGSLYIAAYTREGATLDATIGPFGLQGRFDLRNIDAEKWITANGARMVTAITDNTKAAIRAVVLDGFENGQAPRVMARQIRALIGLTDSQAMAVVNYQAKLEKIRQRGWYRKLITDKDGNPILTDRGKRQFRRVDVKWSKEQVEARAKRYAQKQLNERALSIARTETIEALNAGRYEQIKTAVENGWLSETTTLKWRTALDELVCPVCLPMDGQTIGYRQKFTVERKDAAGEVVETTLRQHPPAHTRCRCGFETVPGGPTKGTT